MSTPPSAPDSAPSFVDPSFSMDVTSGRVPVPQEDIHEQAYHYEPCWQGRALEPFTLARQSLAALLESNNPPLGEHAPAEAYMPSVWAVLWLCSHEPEAWRSLRGNPALWWEQIEAWAAEHCPRPLWAEALLLIYGRRATDTTPAGLGMWEAARANIISIKRDARSVYGRDRVGNAARP